MGVKNIVQGCLMGAFMVFLERVIKESFKYVSRKFQGSIKNISRVLKECFEATSKRVSKQFPGSFRSVLRKFHGIQITFKSVSKKLQNFKGVSKNFRGGLRRFQGCFREILRAFQDQFN